MKTLNEREVDRNGVLTFFQKGTESEDSKGTKRLPERHFNFYGNEKALNFLTFKYLRSDFSKEQVLKRERLCFRNDLYSASSPLITRQIQSDLSRR